MNDRKSQRLMVKMDIIKAFHSLPTAGPKSKVINHSSVVTADVSPALVLPSISPSLCPLDEPDRLLPSYHHPIVPAGTMHSVRSQDIRCRVTVLLPVCPKAHRSGVNLLSSKTITPFSSLHPPLFTHRATDLKNVCV